MNKFKKLPYWAKGGVVVTIIGFFLGIVVFVLHAFIGINLFPTGATFIREWIFRMLIAFGYQVAQQVSVLFGHDINLSYGFETVIGFSLVGLFFTFVLGAIISVLIRRLLNIRYWKLWQLGGFMGFLIGYASSFAILFVLERSMHESILDFFVSAIAFFFVYIPTMVVGAFFGWLYGRIRR